MKLKGMLKKLLAIFCVVAMMLPSITTVSLAAIDTAKDKQLNLGISVLYPKSKLGYKIGTRVTYRTYINNNGSKDYSTYIFCLDKDGKFPSEDNAGNTNYTSQGEFSSSNSSKIGAEAAKKIEYLLTNGHLYNTLEQKIAEVYAKRIADDAELIPPTTVDTIKEHITDDELFFAMQVVIWKITNNLTFDNQAISYTQEEDGKVFNGEGTYPKKTELLKVAIDYYENLANSYNTTPSKPTNPTIKETNKSTVEDGEYLYVGPFHITSGTNTNFTVKFTDQDGNDLNSNVYDYTNNTWHKVVNLKNSLDTDLYIRLPENTSATKVKMELDVTGISHDKLTLWTSNVANAQPLVTVTPDKEDVHDETEATVTKTEKIYDLALRKYITAVNGTEITSRIPSPKYNEEKQKMEYFHRKDPVVIKPGDRVVFTLTVYNEGQEKATATKIKDYLPKGLTVATDSTINDQYGWIPSQDNTFALTDYTKDYELNPFDKTSKQIYSVSLKIECIVSEEFKEGTLTNIAEIVEDNVDDIDSTPGNANTHDEDRESYKGKDSNKDDLTDSNYFYEGQEDDDDFEKLTTEPEEPKKEIDLALRKYIETVNGENKNRKPEVDVSELIAGTAKTAKYNHPKTPVSVKTGDIVTYTIRIYNEGDEDAYANEITDYIPEGLGFLVNHQINYNNGWKIDTENTAYSKDTSTVKLSSIKNATNNVSKSDFIDDGEVADEDVIVGKATIRTDILKYTAGGNNNKIPAFDKTKSEPSSVSVQVTCVVVAEKLSKDTLRNVAAITGEADGDGTEITPEADLKDRDSEPNDVNPDNYPNTNIQDDDDFEDLTLEESDYDLALKKFITKVNGENVEPSREPVVDVTELKQDGGKDAKYTLPKDALKVKYGDNIIYTIRIYNEGDADAIAKEVIDNVPDGLEFVEYEKDAEGNYVSGSKTNYDFGWEKFERQSEKGWTSGVRTEYLKDKEPIKAFDNTKDELSYVDLQIEFKLVSKTTNVIRNIAEITDDDGDDRDSTPDNKDENEDDEDYEEIYPVVFDLSLQKFITGLNDKEITDREPKVIPGEDGNLGYTHTAEPLDVANENIVTYTIRVYNEGNVPGYASVIKDDMPVGLDYLPDNETNKTYMWKMYRSLKEGENAEEVKAVTIGGKQYVEVSNVSEAEIIATDYYSKENCDSRKESAMKAYDPNAEISDSNPDHRDVKVAFKVNQDKIKQEDRVIINTAEIADDQDEEGKPVEDVDSEPNNDKDGEDDIDKEKVTVKYFDLSLLKYVSQVKVTEDGKTKTTNTGYNGTENPEPVVKVEINRKKLNSTKVIFVFTIKVTNEGELEGYAKEITDYIPKGLEFYKEDGENEKYNWKKGENGTVKTDYLKDTLLKPGESATIKISFRWKKSSSNLGLKTNVAEISEDYNEYNTPDIDSTPDNKKDGEDDQDEAPVILSISTGGTPVYVILTISTITIFSCGLFAIKKYVLL